MSRLLAGGLYKVTNSIVEGYQQYLFSGYKGRFGAERLRKIIEHRTALSVALHTGLDTQELRQALIAFLDKYAGHDKAVSVFQEEQAHDIQSGHSSRMAVTHYAISSQDLPSTNRYDVRAFMLVSEAWFRFLGEVAPVQGLKRMLQTAQPSQIGQSVEHSIPAVREVCSNTIEKTTISREVVEIYPEAVNAKLLPVAPATFRLLFELRGRDATFKSALQAAAIQTIISNPGHSFLVILPTGGGKSDIVYISALYELKIGRVTILLVPFVALRYDILDRGAKLGLKIVQWSPGLVTDDVIGAHILLVAVENLDGGHFRHIFSELLFRKDGHSLIARIFFDEARTILGHWDFRPSFQAIQQITSLTIPIVLLSATIPPSKLKDIRAVYSRLDLRIIRAPTTMRPNIMYEVHRRSSDALHTMLGEIIRGFFDTCQMAMVRELYDEFSEDHEGIGLFHGELTSERSTYRLVFTTSGFGVGTHYDDVPMVIHYKGIWSLVDFVQESGRAGRNNMPAKSIVLLQNNWHPNYQNLAAVDAQLPSVYY
ncbi:P-loop containing nucleoside triphosphate hydrolase protein [Lipomyces tetrasporus]